MTDIRTADRQAREDFVARAHECLKAAQAALSAVHEAREAATSYDVADYLLSSEPMPALTPLEVELERVHAQRMRELDAARDYYNTALAVTDMSVW